MRIVIASAVFLALTAGSAFAQTTAAAAPGRPIQLFQVIQQKDETAVRPHHRARYARRAVRTRISHQQAEPTRHAFMQVQPGPEPAPAATPAAAAASASAATPAAAASASAAAPTAATAPGATAAAASVNVWSAADGATPAVEAVTPIPRLGPIAAFDQPVAAANPNDAANPNEMLTAAYHTVQVTPPRVAQIIPADTLPAAATNAANSADMATDHQHLAANATGPNATGPNEAATWPVQQAMIATAEPQNPNPVGSVSWIAHVLAALGGAVAAGWIAWFLINPLPARSYE